MVIVSTSNGTAIHQREGIALACSLHLWFVGVIFLLSLVALPLISLLKEPRGVQVISGFATFCQIPGGILMAGLVFVLCSWFVEAALPVTTGNTLWLASDAFRELSLLFHFTGRLSLVWSYRVPGHYETLSHLYQRCIRVP